MDSVKYDLKLFFTAEAPTIGTLLTRLGSLYAAEALGG